MLKSKKWLSVVVALAMVLALALGVTAFAAIDNTAPNLTNYETYYTYMVDIGEGGMWDFMVRPQNANWQPEEFSEAAIKDVKWSVVDGSTVDVMLADDSGIGTAQAIPGTTGYASKMEVAAMGGQIGVASVQATNELAAAGGTPYMNFTIVVDGTSDPVKNVKYQVYTDDTTLAASGTLAQDVKGTDFYGTTHFASVLDAVMKIGTTAGTGVTVSAADIQQYQTEIGTAEDKKYVNTFMLNKMTVNGTAYENADMTGWQYRVYDANGNILPVSEFVGMDDMPLVNAADGTAMDGCTIVLKFGDWDSITFPNTL